MKKSSLEKRAEFVILANNIEKPKPEHRFHPVRKWRMDFAWVSRKIAVELEGGIWVRGAHSRGAHFNSDSEKYNEATIMGWRVLRYTTNTISRMADDLIRLDPTIRRTE